MRTLFVIAWLSTAGLPAFAGEVEVKAAQSTIEQQLRAFQAGDGERAYSYAAPNIKRLFPTIETFMGMVNGGYKPVANPRSFEFGKVEEQPGGQITQEVLIIGPDGKNYRALYTLELQPDGAYRITGVSLRADNSYST